MASPVLFFPGGFVALSQRRQRGLGASLNAIAGRLGVKPERNGERSECKKRARKRALQKSRVARSAPRRSGASQCLAQVPVVLAGSRPAEKLPTNMYKHMPYAKNNLVAVLAISAVVFARPRPAIHGALGGQEVGSTARRLGGKRQVAQASVILARHRPAEKLSLEIGCGHMLYLKA